MMGKELDELGEFDNEFIDSISKFNVWVWKFSQYRNVLNLKFLKNYRVDLT